MDELLSRILKECPNKLEIISTMKEMNYNKEFTEALKQYINEQSNERQKLSTLYQRLLKDNFTTESEIKTKSEKLTKYEEEIKELNCLVDELRKKEIELKNDTIRDQKIESLEKDMDLLKSSNNLLLVEKSELLSIINRKDVHIQQLDEQWKENVDKLRKANSLKCELQAKLDEYTQNGTLNEWKNKLITQQTEMFENQIKQHLETISNQSNEIIKLKRETNEFNIKIETLKDTKESECNHLKETIKNIKKLFDNLQEKYDKLIEKASNNESLMNMEKLELEKEIKSTHRLNELLTEEKIEFEEALKKHQEIQNELMRKVVDQENENSKLVENLNENNRIWTENISNYDIKVKNLEEELIVAQTLLENSCNLDISKDISKNISKDISKNISKNISFTGNDNSSYLSPLALNTSQLISKGISITQVYADYNRSLETIKELKNEISHILAKSNSLSIQMEQQNELISQLKDEKNRCDLYADHLSKSLLESKNTYLNIQEKLSNLEKENIQLLEEKISLVQLNENLSIQIKGFLHDNISNDKIESNDDLTFKTVEQLQNQNMKLLNIVNNLKNKVEKLSCDPKTIQEYENKLQIAKTEIFNLNDNFEKITCKYETCKKQLDIFMLSNKENENKQIENIQNLDTFEMIRKQCQDLINVKIEQLSEARLEISRLDDIVTHLKSQICHLESQLIINQEQKQNAYNKLENDQKEYNLKEEKIVQLDLLNQQLKENISFYKNNCIEYTEKLNKLDDAYKILNNENIHLRETCKFLELKMETQNNQNNNFSQILTYIQDIQNTLQYKENSTEIKVSSYVDELKEEIKRLRFQLKDSQDNYDVKYQVDIHKLKEELKEKENLIYEIKNNQSNICSNSLINNDNDLQEQIETYKKQVEQFMIISSTAEENLEKNVNIWNDCKSKFENDILQFKNIINEKNTTIEQLNIHIVTLETTLNEKNQLILQFENEQNLKIEPIQKELNMIKERQNEWNITKDNLNLLLKQLREKYEVELISHADDITALKDMNKKYEIMEKKSYNLENDIRTYKLKLETLQNEYNIKINDYELTIEEKIKLQKSVMEQNEILNNQMDELMKQITIFKENTLNIDNKLENNVENNQNNIQKNIQELWELIKFLRRDKEVLQVRLDSFKSEASKYRIKCERLEQGCQNLEASLIAERSILNESNCFAEQTIKLKDVEYTNSQLENKITQLEQTNFEFQQKYDVAKCEAKEFENLLKEKENLILKSNNDIESLKEQILYLNKICDDLKKNIYDLKENNQILKSQIDIAQNKVKTELNKQENQNNKLNQNNLEISNLKKQLMITNNEKENIINQKNEIIKNYQNEINTMKSDINKVENELKTSIKRNQSLHSIATHLKTEIGNLKNNKDNVSNDNQNLQNLQKELSQSKTKNSLMETEVKKLRAQLSSFNSEHNTHLLDRYNKLLQEFTTLKHKYETVVKNFEELKNASLSQNNVNESAHLSIHQRISDAPLHNLQRKTSRISPPHSLTNQSTNQPSVLNNNQSTILNNQSTTLNNQSTTLNNQSTNQSSILNNNQNNNQSTNQPSILSNNQSTTLNNQSTNNNNNQNNNQSTNNNNNNQDSVNVKSDLSKLSVSPISIKTTENSKLNVLPLPMENLKKDENQFTEPKVTTTDVPISTNLVLLNDNLNNAQNTCLINTQREPITFINSPDNVNSESLNRKNLNRLVRRKTPIIGSNIKSLTLSSTPKVVNDKNSNNYSESDLMQFSATQSQSESQLILKDDKNLSINTVDNDKTDDSMFKKPQKRSISQNENYEKDELNLKKSFLENSNLDIACDLFNSVNSNINIDTTNNVEHKISNSTDYNLNKSESQPQTMSIFETPKKNELNENNIESNKTIENEQKTLSSILTTDSSSLTNENKIQPFIFNTNQNNNENPTINLNLQNDSNITHPHQADSTCNSTCTEIVDTYKSQNTENLNVSNNNKQHEL